MNITRFNQAPPYKAPNHFDMHMLRLQGHEAEPSTTLRLGGVAAATRWPHHAGRRANRGGIVQARLGLLRPRREAPVGQPQQQSGHGAAGRAVPTRSGLRNKIRIKICLASPAVASYNRVMQDTQLEIAATAARMVVEEGLEYGPAKLRALKQLGLPSRSALPDNDLVEGEVRDYIDLFCADTQPDELRALRALALVWMERLAQFRPHLGGAVWHGTATRLSDIYLQLFCDDSKSAEIALIDHGVSYATGSANGLHGSSVDVLSIHSLCAELQESVGIHLMIYDHDDVRGALKPDNKGRKPRGDTTALKLLLQANDL